MINNLSIFLTDRYLTKKETTKSEREIYIYGLFMFFSHFIYLVFVCILGCLFKCVIESMAFYVAFYQIRRYAGGYHAKTETRCEILSLLLMFFSMMVIRLSCYYNLQILLFCSLIATIVIFFIAPLDTPEKPLSEKEFIFFRKKTRISLIIILLIAIVSYVFEQDVLYVPCCVSIIAESILIIAGKIKKLKTRAKK